MTVLFSKKCELAVQAVLFLSVQDKLQYFSASDISQQLKVPKEFVSKVLQSLTGIGLVGSKKGKFGGFYLLKPTNDIKLIEVIKAIDGLDVFDHCILGFPGCSSDNPCPMHDKWGSIRETTMEMLSSLTLNEFKEITLKKINSI